MNLHLHIDDLDYYTTVCGANNSGKTNVLRALEIFFKPNKYIASRDAPNHKFHGSRGQSVYPEISVEILEGDNRYEFKRTFDINGEKSLIGKLNNEDLADERIKTQLSKIAFFYLPAININFPDLINELIEEIYDIEYENTRFSGLKGELKIAFDKYISGTLEILNGLAEEIKPVFNEFNENWEVGFEFISDIKKFRDLISNDIQFFFNDKTNRNIDAKGSGLQRLGYILLYSKLVNKIKTKKVVLLIDEPDIYLHSGLQKKLRLHFEMLSTKCQLFITTHSKVFIDSFKLRNTFLLDIKIEDVVTYKRTGKEFYPVNTSLINLDEENGNRKIKQYLGIENEEYDILEDYNILVEGDCDKKYIEELGKFHSIKIPNIISTGGVTNIEKFLNFYNAFYSDNPSNPRIKVIFDNDQAGREEFKKIDRKISNNIFPNIRLKLELIPNHLGELPTQDEIQKNHVKSNFEIEDFIYPGLICELSNQLMAAGKYKTISIRKLEKRISSNSFKHQGILYNIENLKNLNNLDNGQNISFNSTSIKGALAKKFNIEGNRKLIKLTTESHVRYPKVKEFLIKISNY